MLGAIAGDIIGSIYEARPIKKKVYELLDPDLQSVVEKFCRRYGCE